MYIISGRGNRVLGAEFNFHCDPEAALIVLSELTCKAHLITWELCYYIKFPKVSQANRGVGITKERYSSLYPENSEEGA